MTRPAGARLAGPLAVVAVAVLPWIFRNPYYLNTMIFFGINALLVTGLNWILGYTGLVSLGQAGFYGLGAYASAILAIRAGWPTPLALLAALAVTAAVAWFIAIASVRLSGHYLAMATLGFGVILQICFEQMTALTGGPTGLAGIPFHQLGPFVVDSDLRAYYVVWAAVIALTVVGRNLYRSRIGRALRAIESDELAARTSGVAVRRLKIAVFVLGSTAAALAGSLYAHYVGFISPPSFGFMLSIELVVMVILGGSGSLAGPIVGAALFTLLPEYLRAYGQYDVVFFGVVLIVVLMFLPGGIVGGAARAADALRRRVRTMGRAPA